jgi:cellulose synthase/poly-beta-1,6-N-acetylglucosamine synthase-like glycosyltransferase
MLLIFIIERLLFFYFAFYACYNLFFAISSFFYSQKNIKEMKQSFCRFAVIIPGYKEDLVMLASLEEALLQNYPNDKFLLIPVADHFSAESIAEIKKLPVRLIEVNFENSTKAKAINKAFENLQEEDFDYVIILDADNIMEKNYIKKINNFFNNNDSIAVQGHRTAKNLNTDIAVLDAISEEINNTIFRKGHVAIGLSSAIIGSGMAFNFSYFKNLMYNIKAIGGFDKEIELKMLKERKYIYYLDNALIYDEKVSKSKSFYNQRRRWISAQLTYLKLYFIDACLNLIKTLNIDYFDKAIQMAQPPRLFVLVIPSALLLVSFIFFSFYTFIEWFCLVLIVLISLFLSIPLKFYNLRTIISVRYIPKLFFLMLLSLLRIKGANKKFIHTNHEISTNH